MVVGKLKQSGELLVPGIDTRSPLITDGLVAHYPFDGTTHSTNTHFVAKAQNYPYESEDGIWDEYENTWLFNSGRSWHISVWDMYTNDWAVGINFQGATEITGPHARYDVYAVPTQITSFVNTINTLNSSNGRYMVAITGGHAAENNFKDSTVMKDAIKLCGGTTSKLSWTDRRTYICVGEVGCGEGNAQVEELGSTGDVTLRVPFFFYAKASGDNYTLTNDGVAVEEGTTNLVSPINPSFYNGGGLTGSSVYYDTISQRKGVRLITLNGGGVNWYNSGEQKVVSPSTVYTVSAKIKYIGGTPSPNLFYIRQYNSSGAQTSESGKYSPSYQYYIGDGWYKAYSTFTTDSTAIKALVQGYEYSGNRTIWIEDVQLEQKAFPTSYVNGTRAQGTLQLYKPNLINECTINFDYYCTESISNTIISNAQYNGIWWGLYITPSGYLYTHEGIGGSSHISTYLVEKFKWISITIKFNQTMQYYYVDGILRGSIATNGTTTVNNINTIYLGIGWNVGNAKFKNLSIYNRVLSDDEINTLIKGTHKFTLDGLITNGINSRPSIPSDAYYYPLDLNAMDEHGVYNPSEDTGNYTDGLFVGVGNSVEYNFYSSLGLDWNSNWSICYFKKPIGTDSGISNLMGYSLESLGCNLNSVGGGYLWFGKDNNANQLYLTTNSSITPSIYFNNWHCVTLVKTGTSLRIEIWLTDSVSRIRVVELGTISSNNFVTQYGYDFKLGGWDNGHPVNSYYSDLLVLKRSMTQTELDDYRKVKIKANTDNVLIQKSINTLL